MERPKSFYQKPKIDEGKTQPERLTELLKRKGPVDIDAVAEAWTRDLPYDVKQALLEFLVEGPLHHAWCYDILQIDNFPSADARAAYLNDLMTAYSKEKDEDQHLMVLYHIQRDVVRYIINIVRQRILDALFRDANHNCGYGFAVALEHLASGDAVEQQKATLAILRAFGEDFLADQSFPLIGKRYLEHTRSNRKFADDCRTTLTTRYRKKGKASESNRQQEIIWLALRPELVRNHFNGTCPSTELKKVILKSGAKAWDNESSKHFHQFVKRNFGDLQDQSLS